MAKVSGFHSVQRSIRDSEGRKFIVLAALSTGIAALKTLDNLSEVGGEEEKNPPHVLGKCKSLIDKGKRKNITHWVRLVLKDNSRPQRPSLSEKTNKKSKEIFTRSG